MDTLVGVIILTVIVVVVGGAISELGPALWAALRWGRRPPANVDAIREATVSRRFLATRGGSDATGKVEAAGTLWNATCDPEDAARLKVGDRVKVDRVEGLTLEVSRPPASDTMREP